MIYTMRAIAYVRRDHHINLYARAAREAKSVHSPINVYTVRRLLVTTMLSITIDSLRLVDPMN